MWVPVPPGLAGRDEEQPDLTSSPIGHCTASQFGSVVASQDGRIGTALGGYAVQFVDEVIAGDAALHHPAEAFTGVLVDDRHNLDRPPFSGDVKLEVHRPHPVGPISHHSRRCGGGAVPFALASLRNTQALLAPKALDLLVIDYPAFATGIVVGRPEATPRVLLGVIAQPLPQGSVGIVGGRCGRFVALGRAVLPGDAAGEPLADPQHSLEVTNGCPPALRA